MKWMFSCNTSNIVYLSFQQPLGPTGLQGNICFPFVSLGNVGTFRGMAGLGFEQET